MASWGWIFLGVLTACAGVIVYEMGRVKGAMDFANFMKEYRDDAT
jgi:hypothetical protein